MSKAVERLLAPHFSAQLEIAFGATQFAYRKKHGSRDAVALYVLSWIHALNAGCKVGVYCSDVSGAFDRVSSERLLLKLSSLNLDVKLIEVIRSWLRDRSGYVVVAGTKSRRMPLRNMVYQGTVWGPSLWNTFFGDCVCSIDCLGFQVVIYADDCKAFKFFDRAVPDATILDS